MKRALTLVFNVFIIFLMTLLGVPLKSAATKFDKDAKFIELVQTVPVSRIKDSETRQLTHLALFPEKPHAFLMLLPGGPGNASAADFDPQNSMLWNRLVQNGIGVVFYSPRGINETFLVKDEDKPQSFSIHEQAQDIISLIEDLKSRHPSSKIWIHGFSHGAVVALNVTEHFPQLVDGLVLENPSLGGNTPPSRVRAWYESEAQRALELYEQLKERLERSQNDTKLMALRRYMMLATYSVMKSRSSELPFLVRGQIESTLEKCLFDINCWELRAFEDWIERHLQPPWYSERLARSVGCLNLGWNCKESHFTSTVTSSDKVNMSYFDRAKEFAQPVLILKSRRDLTAETNSRIIEFFTKLSSSDKKLVIHPEAGHSLHREDPRFSAKYLVDFISLVRLEKTVN